MDTFINKTYIQGLNAYKSKQEKYHKILYKMNPNSYITLDKACDLIGFTKTDNYAQYFRRSFLNSSTIQRNANDSAKEYINFINEHKDLWFQGLPKQFLSQKSFQRVRTSVNRLLENEEFLQEFGVENAQKVKISMKGHWLCNRNNYLDNSKKTVIEEEQPQENLTNESSKKDSLQENIVLLNLLKECINESREKEDNEESDKEVLRDLYHLTSYLHQSFNSIQNDNEKEIYYLLNRMKLSIQGLNNKCLSQKLLCLFSDLEKNATNII
jgi:hypothetical protein